MDSEKEEDTIISEDELDISDILKYPIRIKTLVLLLISPKLNLSQITNILNESKSTVNRHLHYLQSKGILISEVDEKSPKNLKPTYYSIHPLIMIGLDFAKEMPPSEPTERQEHYQLILTQIRMIHSVVKISLNLLEPFVQNLQNILEDLPKADKTFNQYFYKNQQLKLHKYFFNQSQLPEFLKLYKNFQDGVLKLQLDAEENRDLNRADPNFSIQSDSFEPPNMLYVDTLLPILDLLKLKI